MHMGVDRNRRQAVTKHENAICGLWSDAGEREQLRKVARDVSAEVVAYDP
jgi:hypothetical protein